MAFNYIRIIIFLTLTVGGGFYASSAFAVKVESLRQSIIEVADFSHYTARPIVTSSCAEAFEKVKEHCRTMNDYHEDMALCYEERIKQYNNEKDICRATAALKLFLKNILGFSHKDNNTNLQFIKALRLKHLQIADGWLKKLAGLTGEVVQFSVDGTLGTSNRVFSPNKADSQHLIKALRAHFDAIYEDFQRVKDNPQKYTNNKIVLTGIDELWALRYAYALILPWTKEENKEIENKPTLVIKENKRKKKKKQKVLEQFSAPQLATDLFPLSVPGSLDGIIQKEEGAAELISPPIQSIEELTEEDKLPEVVITSSLSAPESLGVVIQKEEGAAELISPPIQSIEELTEKDKLPEVVITSPLPTPQIEQLPLNNIDDLVIPLENYQAEDEYNYQEDIAKEQKRSNEKKQKEPLSRPSLQEEVALKIESQNVFYLDKESFGYFLNLFENTL